MRSPFFLFTVFQIFDGYGSRKVLNEFNLRFSLFLHMFPETWQHFFLKGISLKDNFSGGLILNTDEYTRLLPVILCLE